MSLIMIDLNGVERISTLANSISDELNTCSKIVNTLSDHNDWNCKERDDVIEKTENIKKAFTQLAELSNTFASEMFQLKSEFEQFSSLVPNEIAQTNSSLGQSYSIKSTMADSNVGVNTSAVASGFADIPVNGGMENYALASVTQPISACSYESVDLLGTVSVS